MLFPENLDDRTFRLFVQRTCHLMRTHLALSQTEQQLAKLLNGFPELGFLSQKKDVDINRQYAEEELNPFLFLAALWQVWQQLMHDSPTGILNIVNQFFDSKNLSPEDLIELAHIYLTLYDQFLEKGRASSEKDYLYDVMYLLKNMDASN